MYQYQTPILIKEKYDFSKVKPEGQKELSEMMGYDFTLVDVVQYLKKISKNFTEQDTLSLEIDKTIANIVEAHHSDTQTPNPLKPSVPDETPSVPDVVSTIETEINFIKEAIDYLQSEADAGDEESKDALEYLRDELSALTKQIK